MGPAFIEIKVEEVAAIFVGGLVSLAADTFITPLLGNNGFMPNFFNLFYSLGKRVVLNYYTADSTIHNVIYVPMRIKSNTPAPPTFILPTPTG